MSPLRYPGGKAKLFRFFCDLIDNNGIYGHNYAEPYAGGAGLALKLLVHGYVSRIELNDVDYAIASFWQSILSDTDNFCRLLTDTPVTVDQWRRQREIYNRGRENCPLELGFAAYFLNRTSRSGIIEGSGPIGGYLQGGNWLIDARFDKKSQTRKICEIATFSNQISVSCLDAVDFIKPRLDSGSNLIYLDPPYFVKGQKLYKNFYAPGDHAQIAEILKDSRCSKWVLSYDFAPEIVAMYATFNPIIYKLQYTAGKVGMGNEVIFLSDVLRMPESYEVRMVA